jgi:hypothetical protein
MTRDDYTLDAYKSGQFAFAMHHLTRADAQREAADAQGEGYATRILNSDGTPVKKAGSNGKT